MSLVHRFVIIGFLSIMGFVSTLSAAQFNFSNQTITVPDGFEVELVAGADLVERPISGSFDEQGRLYVTDSSGSNEKPAEQLEKKPHRIVRLEDTDGDGKFDKTQVFADKMMFPEGCLWYDGSLYVAAPPSIWKLTDTNGDGVVDIREEWHKGQTLTGCANDLHGPYLGPDGWLYWCKGAFAKQTYELDGGKHFESKAAHIFRARPDHSGMEPIMTGGMDNPVGLAFTAEGEKILCGTFFETHVPGHRDGLIHVIYGGVYGKINDVTDDAKKTGDLMPIMTHMGPAAPCSVIRYESKIFGDEYQNNLFVCSFNLHKVTRHILEPDGATFKTKDSDFVVSDNPDFHPTDVIEDADGSLLILNTGGWYKICCPTSQLSKPDVLGAIYRIRRVGAKKVEDPRGLRIAWKKLTNAEVTALLADERPVVQHRAIFDLAKKGREAVANLRHIVESGRNDNSFKPNNAKYKSEWVRQHEVWWKAKVAKLRYNQIVRQNAIWTLTRINAAEARHAVSIALDDFERAVRFAAYESISLHRDKEGGIAVAKHLNEYMNYDEWRSAFEVIGRASVFTKDVAAWVVAKYDEDAIPIERDRVIQHSLSYALIESNAKEPARFLARSGCAFGPPALVSFDQMEKSDLKAKEVTPLLTSDDPQMRKAALWVTLRHSEWGAEVAGYFRERFRTQDLKEDDWAELEQQLVRFEHSEAIQELIPVLLNEHPAGSPAWNAVMRAMAEANLKKVPGAWISVVKLSLAQSDPSVLRSAVAAAKTLSQIKTNTPNFLDALAVIARNQNHPAELRLEAVAALPNGLRSVEAEMFAFLCSSVDPSKTVTTRSAAAIVLAKSKLTEEQLLALAETIKNVGPLELTKIVTAFERSKSEAVGLKLVRCLKEARGVSSLRVDLIKTLLAKYPASVQEQGNELIALLNVDAGKQSAHIDELLKELKDGDVRRGQAVFNSQRAACFSCHTMGYLGGKVGPDLTSIGQARTERDLLESVIYPSASFVRSFEPYIVATKSDETFSGVLKKDAPDEVVLATGPGAEVRIARADITEMRPGTVSVMPAGLEQQMTKQELADLLAFLKSTKWGPR